MLKRTLAYSKRRQMTDRNNNSPAQITDNYYMNITKADNLACPIDGLRLNAHEKYLACDNGHVFDIARQGYVNLLPVQHKRSKHPGDSQEMVAARSQFLDSGIYAPIAKMLAEITSAQISGNEDICILDAGCGEGYYTDMVFNSLKEKEGSGDLSFIGLDISKPAITAAARRNKLISWVVGTNRQPAVTATSVDIILCVFGFQSFEGFTTPIKSGGKIILVEPGPDHLKELREIIYTDVKKSNPQELYHNNKMEFSIKDRLFLNYRTQVNTTQQINNLLIMTPHLYRATKEGRESACNLQKLDITVDVVFSLFEKD